MAAAKYDAEQAQQYWKDHVARRAQVDLDADPEGLNNVCHPGRPLWFNAYYAKYQRIVFEKLLGRVDADLGTGPKRALDVGCGAGRWCRILQAHGYDTTGVDLQEDLLRRNRERIPGVRFVHGSMQDFASDAPFDLVTTVTVIQHNPPDAQDRMIATMRLVLRTGGQVIALENVADQDVHVFAHSIEGWRSRFERAGFRLKNVHRYDYSPFLRANHLATTLVRGLASAPARLFRPSAPQSLPLDPGAPGPQSEAALRRAARAAQAAVLRVLVSADSLIEGPLVEANLRLPTIHCGFQFEAV